MRTAIQTGGALLSALWTIAFNVLTLAGVGTLLGYSIDWRWFTLGGFIAFCGFVGWIIYDYRRRIKKLEESRPSIEVRPVNDFDDYYLEVKNIGDTGKFEAQIQMLEGNTYTMHRLNQYLACWEYANEMESRILRNQFDRIKIATLITGSPSYISQHLRLYYFNSTSRQGNYVSSSGWFVGSKVIHTNGTETPTTKPEFVLQVTISSEPSLKEGSFIKKYKLSLDGLEELAD